MRVRTRYHLDQILRLDPIKDCERIVYLSSCYEFPFDNARALEFALFRTFAVPSVGELLDATGEFSARAQRRYDDTDLLISTFVEGGFSSPQGLAAIRRMNQLHGRFNIVQSDYLYVLSTFVVEPCRWKARFGWRPFTEHERVALFSFWSQVGRLMNIHDIPASYEALEAFNVDYERAHFAYSAASRRVALATRELLVRWRVPAPFRPLARHAIHAMLDEPLREAFGLPRAPQQLYALIERTMQARAWTLATLAPERRFPVLRTELEHPSYPDGYTLEELGPKHAPKIEPRHLKRPAPAPHQHKR